MLFSIGSKQQKISPSQNIKVTEEIALKMIIYGRPLLQYLSIANELALAALTALVLKQR